MSETIKDLTLKELIDYFNNNNNNNNEYIIEELIRSRKRVLILWTKHNHFFINYLGKYFSEKNLIQIIECIKNTHSLTRGYFELTKFILNHNNTTSEVLIELLKSQKKKGKRYLNLITKYILQNNKTNFDNIEIIKFLKDNQNNNYLKNILC